MRLFRMNIRIPRQEAPVTYEESDNHFNYGATMQCIVAYATGMYS